MSKSCSMLHNVLHLNGLGNGNKLGNVGTEKQLICVLLLPMGNRKVAFKYPENRRKSNTVPRDTHCSDLRKYE
jgi:hypothetical protein